MVATLRAVALAVLLVAGAWPSGVAAEDVQWIDAATLGVHGRAFPAARMGSPFDRLPAEAQGNVSDAVWSLSRDSAGLYLQFESDAANIETQIEYLYSTTYMWHFPSTGVAGLDLFAWDAGNNTWRWVSTTTHNNYPNSTNTLLMLGRPARYRMNLPLYNSMTTFKLGVSSGSYLRPDSAWKPTKPVIWYGTSIAQGGVASRPGMAFTNIIARNLSRDVFNFGFSGHGLMELNVAQYLVQIPTPAAIVIDCNWNMQGAQILERGVPLVNYLRKAFPTVPIVLAENTESGQAWISPSARELQTSRREALRQVFSNLTGSDANLHYVSAEPLYNISGDPRHLVSPTVGGTHPSDLGQMAIASFYTRYLPTLIKDSAGPPQLPADDTGSTTAASILPASRRLDRLHHHTVTSSMHSPSSTRRHHSSKGASIVYTDAKKLGVMGKAFQDTERFFQRLPAAAQGQVRTKVWNLSQMSTGMFVPFVTNSPSISVKYSLEESPEPLWHMTAASMHGIDLFRWDPVVQSYRFVATLEEFPQVNQTLEHTMIADLPTNVTERHAVFLPLRNEVVELYIGVESGATLGADTSYHGGIYRGNKKPIVWYGTSILQGGVASRPGGTYSNVLTRSLDRVVLNFGFAGNGLDEPSVTQYLSVLDAELFVLDCLPNLGGNEIYERTLIVVRAVRNYTQVPILLVAGTTYGDFWIDPSENNNKRDGLKRGYDELVAAGVKNLHLFLNEKNELFGGDFLVNPTVGGVHPSDLGHREMVNFYNGFLPPLLQE